MMRPDRPIYERVTSIIVSCSLVVMFCSLLFAIVTMAWPYDQLPRFIMTVEGSPQAGQEMTVKVDYCKAHDWPASQMRWSLQNSVTIGLDWQPFTILPGCHVIHVALPLSHKIPAGFYVLQQEVFYDPWPWRTIAYVHRSQPFLLKGQ